MPDGEDGDASDGITECTGGAAVVRGEYDEHDGPILYPQNPCCVRNLHVTIVTSLSGAGVWKPRHIVSPWLFRC